MPKRKSESSGPLSGRRVACGAPLVYFEDGRGSYYLTCPALKHIVESHGGSFQSGPANSVTDIFLLGDVSKEVTNGVDSWTGCPKQIAFAEQQFCTAKEKRHVPLEVHQSLSSFVRAYNLEDAAEPELLWAFTNSHNSPPPEGRKKNFMSIGNTCVATDYEKSIGITSGYSRGRYVLHTTGFWPDRDTLLEMHARYSKPKGPPAGKVKPADTVQLASTAAVLVVD
uniref:BRCT domain-containing protein n=1 Tax=Prymnesium polylepis TaxID=72548 RepID=A0A7S4MXL7_9EUKA